MKNSECTHEVTDFYGTYYECRDCGEKLMVKDANSKEHWNEKWEKWEKDYIKAHTKMYEAVRPYMKGQIIDLGCGNGYVGHDAGDRYSGIDISEVAIKRAKELNPKGTYVVGQAHNTPFTDKSADTVLLLAVVEHYLNFNPLLDEALRLCRGRIVMTLPYQSHGSEHYHPHFSMQKVVSSFERLGELIEYRQIKHDNGKWILVIVETQ